MKWWIAILGNSIMSPLFIYEDLNNQIYAETLDYKGTFHWLNWENIDSARWGGSPFFTVCFISKT